MRHSAKLTPTGRGGERRTRITRLVERPADSMRAATYPALVARSGRSLLRLRGPEQPAAQIHSAKA
eukprot:6891865-Prymnesium_polylepis.1